MGLNMGSFPQVKDSDVEGYMRGSRGKVRKEMSCTYDEECGLRLDHLINYPKFHIKQISMCMNFGLSWCCMVV